MSGRDDREGQNAVTPEKLETLLASLSQKVARLEERLVGLEGRLDQLTRAHLDPTEKIPYLDYLVQYGGLKPDHAVLDVGCGPGRIAKELSRYLDARGRYVGIEIQLELVNRLRAKFAGRANFAFHHADLRNTEYNARGTIQPADYKFPVTDDSVDLVVLRSVFTHMLPAEVETYMGEISRVLRAGGRSLITYYLLNDQSRPFVAAAPLPVFSAYPFDGRGSFPYDHGSYRVRYQDVPERAVAYDEVFVRELYLRHGQHVQEPIRYGSWSGRTRYVSGQDLIVAEKAHRPSGE